MAEAAQLDHALRQIAGRLGAPPPDQHQGRCARVLLPQQPVGVQQRRHPLVIGQVAHKQQVVALRQRLTLRKLRRARLPAGVKHFPRLRRPVGDDLVGQAAAGESAAVGDGLADRQEHIHQALFNAPHRAGAGCRQQPFDCTIVFARAGQALGQPRPAARRVMAHQPLLRADQAVVMQRQDQRRARPALERQVGMHQPVMGVDDLRPLAPHKLA